MLLETGEGASLGGGLVGEYLFLESEGHRIAAEAEFVAKKFEAFVGDFNLRKHFEQVAGIEVAKF